MGFVSFPQSLPTSEDKLRGKPEKFADHYTQARLFYRSQSEIEQRHVVRAFRFERRASRRRRSANASCRDWSTSIPSLPPQLQPGSASRCRPLRHAC